MICLAILRSLVQFGSKEIGFNFGIHVSISSTSYRQIKKACI